MIKLCYKGLHKSQHLHGLHGLTEFLLLLYKKSLNNKYLRHTDLFSAYSCTRLVALFLQYRIASACDPFLPALPISCTKSSRLCGSPQLIILAMSGILIPSPKALLAITSLKTAFSLQNLSNITSLIPGVEAACNKQCNKA